MANFDQLKQSVAALIRTNGAEEITGQIMQDVLLTIINSISGGYMFGGVAQHNGNVGNPDYNVFYLAGSGSYTGYGGAITIEAGCYGVFRYNGVWTQEVVDIGVRLSGSIVAGETRGVTGDVINTALQTLFDNVMNILDTLTFTYNTPSAQQATKAMLDVIMTPTGGAPHVLTTLTLASATVAAAGLMSAEDKQKVDRMLTDFRSFSLTDTTAAADQATKIVQTLSATLGENPEAITTMTFLAATASKAGLMSAADKAVLDCLVAMLGYYECPTAAGTAAKVVSASGYALTSGGCIRIKMNNANTANNVTLNINSTGAKALYYDGAQASSTNTWEAGEVLEVYYDGTQYQCASGGGGKFATGQKVKDVGITDEIELSDDLVTSAGLYKELYMETGLTPSQSDFLHMSLTENQTGFRTTTIRCLYLLPDNVAQVKFTQLTSGYEYNFIAFNAADPTLPLINRTGTVVYNSGWQSTIPATYICENANTYLVHMRKSNDGNITEAEAFTNIKFEFSTAGDAVWKQYVPLTRITEEVSDDNKIPTGAAIIDYIEGKHGLSPEQSDIQRISLTQERTAFRDTTIRCMYKLPLKVSEVRFTQLTSGYDYDFIAFNADDPTLPLISCTGTVITDSGWMNTIPNTFKCTGANMYIIHMRKQNNGTITPTEAFTNIKFEYDIDSAIFESEVYDLKNDDYTIVDTDRLTLDLTAHRCFKKWEFFSSLYSLQNLSPQGSAIYDDYLFVYFNGDQKLRTFDVNTGVLLGSISLAGVGHGNSMQFGEAVQDTGFPYLYISGLGAGEDAMACVKVSLTTAEVVRTIVLDNHALSINNCAIDFHKQKLYVSTFDNAYSGNVKIIRYSVAGLETSTSATFTPTYEADAEFSYLGVVQGVTFFGNTFAILTSDYDETFAKLHFFINLQKVETWTWEMNNDSECQGVTPVYQNGQWILVIPAWLRYSGINAWYYRLQYIN